MTVSTAVRGNSIQCGRTYHAASSVSTGRVSGDSEQLHSAIQLHAFGSHARHERISWLCDLKWNSHQRSDRSNLRGSVKNASQLSLDVKRKIECPEFNHLFVTGFVPLRSKVKPHYRTATNPGKLRNRPECKCSTPISLNLSVVSLRPWPSRLVVASTSAARCRNLLRTCFLSGPGTVWP